MSGNNGGLSKSEGSNSKNKSLLLDDLDKKHTINETLTKNGNTVTNGKNETDQKKKKNLFSSLFEKKKMEMDNKTTNVNNKDNDNDYIVVEKEKSKDSKEMKSEKNIEIEKETKNGE
jgi:hypothetical protein